MYKNKDNPKSFKQEINGTLTKLNHWECSEVVIINRSGDSILIFDNNNVDPDDHLLILDGESMTFRGLTNSESVSALTENGATGDIYVRANFYSNHSY